MDRLPYVIEFYPLPLVAPGKRLQWVRFYRSLDEACADAPCVLAREYPHAEISAIRLTTMEAIDAGRV